MKGENGVLLLRSILFALIILFSISVVEAVYLEASGPSIGWRGNTATLFWEVDHTGDLPSLQGYEIRIYRPNGPSYVCAVGTTTALDPVHTGSCPIDFSMQNSEGSWTIQVASATLEVASHTLNVGIDSNPPGGSISSSGPLQGPKTVTIGCSALSGCENAATRYKVFNDLITANANCENGWSNWETPSNNQFSLSQSGWVCAFITNNDPSNAYWKYVGPVEVQIVTSCSGKATGTACPAGTAAGDGMYCSDGPSDAGQDGICCPNGEYRDPDNPVACTDSTSCYNDPDPGESKCDYTTDQLASYLADVGCFDADQLSYTTGNSCCFDKPLFNIDNYKYTSIGIVNPVGGTLMDGITLCTTEILCGAGPGGSDGICPEDYTSQYTCKSSVCDPDCGSCAVTCTEGDSRSCGTDTGVCSAGTETCSGGAWVGCSATWGGSEVCADSLDNNCNGAVDEGCGGVACSGTTPAGSGVAKGADAYTAPYSPTSWTYTSGAPNACQWTCQSGYTQQGNTCVLDGSCADSSYWQSSQLPSDVEYLSCASVGDKLYCFGGNPDPGNVFIHDSASDTVSTGAAIPQFYSASCVGTSQYVYCFGGYNPSGGGYRTDVIRYSPATDSYSVVGSLPQPRSELSCDFADNGLIYCAGGHIGTGPQSEIFSFNPSTNTASTVGSLSLGRRQAACAAVGDDLYCFGGIDGSSARTTTIQFFDSSAGTTSVVGSLPGALQSHDCVYHEEEGMVYCFGGFGGVADSAVSDEIVEFNPVSNTASLSSAVLQKERFKHSCDYVDSNRNILCTGGEDNSGTKLKSVEKFIACYSVCGNGIPEYGEQCDGGACCTASCTYESAGTTCGGSSTYTCASSCEATRNYAACTGGSAQCPALTTESKFATTSGEVCVLGNFQAADCSNYCGTSTNDFCSGQTPSQNRYGCFVGVNTCGASGAVCATGAACSGTEDDLCYGGSCMDGCYTIDSNTDGNFDENNNGNSLIDSQETGVCSALCTQANCQGSGYDTCACASSNPGAPWTSSSFACSGAGESCYAYSCPSGTTWNAGVCEETTCDDAIDNDGDGNTDFDDSDCNDQNNPPVINSFTATPNTGYAPFTTQFDFQITDGEDAVEYMIDFGDGTSTSWISGSKTVTDFQSHTYSTLTTFTATLTTRDTLLQTVTATTSVTAGCNAGSPTGTPATSPSQCCSTACYYNMGGGNAYCFSDAESVCIPGTDQVCNVVDGTLHDRDESQVYAELTTSTCNAVAWIDSPNSWCENGNCDTFDGNTAYACGDDANENYEEYQRYNDYYDTTPTTHYGCTISGAGCFGMDAAGNYAKNSGSETCTETDVDGDCNGYLPYYDSACFVDVSGRVWIKWAEDNTYSYAPEPEVWTIRYPGSGRNDDVIEVQASATGQYQIDNLPAGPFSNRNVNARLLDAVTSQVNVPGGDFSDQTDMDIFMEELVCDPNTCLNNYGTCDRGCLGKNGCPTLAQMTSGEREVFEASHPEYSSVGKQAGELVFLDSNETHRKLGVSCLSEPYWELAPRADVRGGMSNLIKYTRLVRLYGLPVRLVIATWN